MIVRMLEPLLPGKICQGIALGFFMSGTCNTLMINRESSNHVPSLSRCVRAWVESRAAFWCMHFIARAVFVFPETSLRKSFGRIVRGIHVLRDVHEYDTFGCVRFAHCVRDRTYV